ncbi:MAG TPA: hypothetical protein VFN37_09160, partial [Candidatus Baltobacteraceae bacterium]|nr:hypothetical protein [Candidatus Baltobacteraceae bacterium]
MTSTTHEQLAGAPLRVPRLAFLDRYLTLWILIAMGLGIALGAAGMRLPAIVVPIGLIVMMYPPFARVRYEALPAV